MKRCSKCKEYKSVLEFYNDKRTKDGLKCQCKKCHIETSIKTRDKENAREINKLYMRRARSKNPFKFREQWNKREKRNDVKTKARIILNTAVRASKIAKPNKCQKCGGELRLTAHHSDYNKPLEVEWLCYGCHAKKHIKAS